MCDIWEVIAAAANTAAAAAQNASVEIVLEVHEAIKWSLLRTRMQSVFFILIINALEAMPTGGEVNWTGRGSFDRGDLKEVGGAMVRAMEPQAVY
jgi:signal transduction histidine kinase